MIRFLANPRAGRRGAGTTEQLRRMAAAFEASFEVPGDIDELVRSARRAANEGVERLVVCGGDGTLHHVVQVLADSACALGIVPAGTGNDFARAVGVPTDLARAVESAVLAPLRSIDLGRIGSRLFTTVAGAGFHGEVARYVDERVGGLRGPWVYPYAVLRTLSASSPAGFRVEYDGGSFEGRAWMVVLANAAMFGGGMKIAPQAVLDDGLLDLVIVRDVSKSRLLRVFPRVYRGRHVGDPSVVMARTRRATIEIDRPHTCYGDGEPLLRAGSEPVRLEVRPSALRIAAPGAAA